MGDKANISKDLVANDTVINDNTNKKSTNSLLGFVANTLNTSAAWSRRPNNQQYQKSTKNIYNYASRIDGNLNNKTAMCRIAEIARHNKLKHEYILMDENGPAHMKYFTVKLALCPTEEYIGHGASIKKAQEAAANEALQNTALKTPPSRGRNKYMEPVLLLNQVAYQLNLSVNYESESICVPVKLHNPRPQSASNESSRDSTSPLKDKLQNVTAPITPSVSPYSAGVSSPFPVGPFCSNLSLPLPTTATPNVVAFNTGLLVSPPMAIQPQPFQAIQSMLYQQILNCNNTTLRNCPALPQHTSQRCDLRINHNLQLATLSSTRAASINRFSIPNTLTSMNSQSKEWDELKKLNPRAIYSIPPLFLFPQLMPPFTINGTAPFVKNGLELVPHIVKQTITQPLNDIHNIKNNIKNRSKDSKSPIGSVSKKNLRVYRYTLKLGDDTKHIGVGADRGTAKSNAATQALKYLRPLLESLQKEIHDDKKSNSPSKKLEASQKKPDEKLSKLSEELDAKMSLKKSEKKDTQNDTELKTEDEGNKAIIEQAAETPEKPYPKKKKKSIISMIHELAIQLRMDIEFENISVIGEAHNRVFTVRCRFVSPNSAKIIEADGRGTSKKWAKQNACQMIYEKIKGLEKDPVYLANMVVKKARRPTYTYPSKGVKRKILVKQRRSDPQYGQWVNPVCRLMQIMQSSGKPDPVFKLLGELGHSKFKEFVIQVSCMDKVAEGRSQNKRLAKRAAADEMLRLLGYAKEMPQPGKSLLKKNTKPAETEESGDLSSSPENFIDEQFSPFVDEIEQKATSFDTMETFADVDEILKIAPPTTAWTSFATSQSLPKSAVAPVRAESSSPIFVRKDEVAESVRKRRVTFNNQVSACPPPDDASYPEASIAPLKSEVLFVGSRLRKRGRDSKKLLTIQEKAIISSVTNIFLRHRNQSATTASISPLSSGSISDNSSPTNLEAIVDNALQSAKNFLDVIAKTHKFSVIYSDFPKTEQCFSLVTLGIDKPIVCPGSGNTENEAHEDAALNAIKELSKLSHDFNSI